MPLERLFEPQIVDSLHGYRWSSLLRDIKAGLMVAAFAFPLCLAFGASTGLGPGVGLITSIVAGAAAALLGGSRVQVSGPTAAFIVVVSGIVALHGQAGLLVAALLAGGLMLLFGVLRLGLVLRYLPQPILVGFTAGIAVTLIVHTLLRMCGISVSVGHPNAVANLSAFFTNVDEFNPFALVLGLASAFVVYGGERWAPKVPWTLAAVVAGGLGAAAAGLPVTSVKDVFGELSLAPHPMHSMSWQTLVDLVPAAFTLAFLGSVESLLSASVADGLSSERHRPNTELIGQGFANVASSLLGGLPATGALGRTNVNVRSGGRTPVAALFHSVVLLAAALLFAPWIPLVPVSVLAGVVLAVALRMADVKEFRRTLRATQSDALALLTTFGVTVLFDLAFAVISGLLVAFFFFVRDMAQTSHTISGDRRIEVDLPPGATVLDLNGAFFFGAAGKFDEAIRPLLKRSRTVLLRMDDVNLLDATGTRVLHRILQDAAVLNVRVVMCEVQPPVLRVMEQSELIAALGTRNLFASFEGALRDVRTNQPLVFSVGVEQGCFDPLS